MQNTQIDVVVNVMYEQWEEGVAPGAGPMANPLRGGLDLQAVSWANYGRRTGIWALLNLFDQLKVAATFHCSGILAESTPDSVRAITDAGHDLAGHGWAQNIVPAEQDLPYERKTFADTWNALREATGTTPTGWLSPRCTPSANTAMLTAEHGGVWFGDVFDTDLPYMMATESGPIVALPFTSDVNDLPLSVRYGRPMESLLEDYTASVEARRAIGAPGMVDVTVHAHLGARPRGLHALRRIIESAREDGARLLTKYELAQEWSYKNNEEEEKNA